MTSQINTTRKINKDVKLDQTKSELIKVSTSFYQRGWMLGTSGNLSILIEENPLQFLITVSGKDKGELTEDDFILVNESGVIARSNSDEAIPNKDTIPLTLHTRRSELLRLRSQ